MSTNTYFRVQAPEVAIDSLLDADRVSSAWNGNTGLDRTGVSVCDSLETLAAYLAGAGQAIPFGQGGWMLVELEGDILRDETPVDAAYGEYLIRPTRVVEAQEIPESFFDMIGAAYEEALA